MLYLLSGFGDSSSGLGALGVDWQAFIIQLITFVLAYLVLRRWAFEPILKVLRQRRQTIESGVQLGEDMKKEKAQLEAKVEQTLQETRRQADGILADAHTAARQTISDAEAKARDKAEGILQAAEGRIAQDTSRARQELEKQLAGLVADATEVMIDEKLDVKKDGQLIERALKEQQTV